MPAAAGLRPACVVAGVERVTARARVHGVRVVDREAGAHQAVDVVDLGAADIRHAEVVDEDLDAFVVDDEVVGPALVVEGHAVLHARAPAAADEDAEGKAGILFLGEQLLEARLGYRRPSLNPFFSPPPLLSAAVEPAMICASCSAPRERALFGSVSTRISPLTAASSGLVPSKSISTASC